MPKLYKVWSCDRSERKAVIASSFSDLVKKGKDKLALDRRSAVTVVLEADGTEVDDQDYFSTLPAGTRFILLKEGESWSSHSARVSVPAFDETDSVIPGVGSQIEGEHRDVLRMLRADISKIVTLNTQELEFLVGLEASQLVSSLDVTCREASRIQNKCQTYLDEVQESQDTMDLLRMMYNSQSTQDSSEPSSDGRDSQTSGSDTTEGGTSKKRKVAS